MRVVAVSHLTPSWLKSARAYLLAQEREGFLDARIDLQVAPGVLKRLRPVAGFEVDLRRQDAHLFRPSRPTSGFERRRVERQ